MSRRQTDPIHPATWQYARTSHIAREYDDYFDGLPLFRFDSEVLESLLASPARVIDLGCGTGRHLVQLARRGFDVTGIDLSPFMLDVAREKLAAESLDATLVSGTITDLSRFEDDAFRYAICMFSTLGLIRGAANRLAFLTDVRRILEPGGLLVVHVHNRLFKIREAGGLRWLIATTLAGPFGDLEAGDLVGEYRGIPDMFLHTFTLGELRRLLKRAGFDLEGILPLNAERSGPLRPAVLPSWRANGFIAAGRKGPHEPG